MTLHRRKQYREFFRIFGPKAPPSKRCPRFPSYVVSNLRNVAGDCCTYCRSPFVDEPNHPRQMTVDHVVSRALGGNNRRDNLVAACRQCNARKKTLSADAYRERLAS